MNIEWLLECGPHKSFAAGEVIPCPTASAGKQKAMYILLSGSVDVFTKIAARELKKSSSLIVGDVFGGQEFFYNVSKNVYRASSDTSVFLLTEESFNDVSFSQPEILLEVLRSAYAPPRPPTPSADVAAKTAPVAAATSPAPTKATPPVPAKVATVTPAPTKAPAPAKVAPATTPTPTKATTPAPKPATAKTEVKANGIFLPGHKVYTNKEFPMNEKLVYAKEYTCPFCKKTFQDFRVFRSKLYENRPMRFDLRKFYTGFNIEWYDVITCHNCFFSMFHNYFTEPKPIKRGVLDEALTSARAEIHLDFRSARDINLVFTMYYLAILCADGFPAMSNQLRAKLWGNLSWLYEDIEDKEMERAAADKAAEAYEYVYTHSRLTPVQEQVTCLSIAGMQYRAGTDRNLKKYLFTAKTNKTGDLSYTKIADDFWYDLSVDNL